MPSWLTDPVLVQGWLITGVNIFFLILHRAMRRRRGDPLPVLFRVLNQGVIPTASAITVIWGLVAAVKRMSEGTAGTARIQEAGFLLLASILVGAMIALAGMLAMGERISLESKWGSLGGARLGYDLSRSMALLSIMMACVLGLMVIGYDKDSEKKTGGGGSTGGIHIGVSQSKDGAK